MQAYNFMDLLMFNEKMRDHLKHLPSAKTGNPKLDQLDFDEMLAYKYLRFNPVYKKDYQQRFNAMVAEKDRRITEFLLYKRARRREIFSGHERYMNTLSPYPIAHSQASVTENADMDTGEVTISETHENVTDYVGTEEEHTSSGVSLHDTADGGKTMHHLDDFFQRPISVYSNAIGNGNFYNLSINIWDEWSKNPAVRAKFKNYAYFKGNLKAKITVTGTPYNYGRVLASYQPYAVFNDNLSTLDTMLQATNPALVNSKILYKSYLSQAPGATVIDIKENQPVTMDIPFISYKQKFRLFNNSGDLITSNTSLYDFAEAGELRLCTLNEFKTSNSESTANPVINVFVWAENVELGTITSTEMDISSESKMMKNDEYEKPGPVAVAATAVSSISSRLSDVPIIGKFARATTTLANGIAEVANLFGWSKPEVLTPAIYVKNQPFQNGAVLSGNQTAYKIAADPKNELSVDPTIGGIADEDEMAIATLCSKPAWIGSFDWTDQDNAMDTVLWRAGISPMMGVSTTVAAPSDPIGSYASHVFQDSPMAFAARPFQYWRGNVKLCFEVVCSKFHRGKLLFRYEPNSAQYNLLSTGDAALNETNTVILDIQNGQTITLDVDWSNFRSWCSIPGSSNDNNASNYSNDCRGSRSGPYIADLGEPNGVMHANEMNGILEVRVLNDLVQPEPDASVSINVYAWSDDMQFAYPTKVHLPRSRTFAVTPYPSTTNVSSESLVKEICPKTITINPSGANTKRIYDDHFGEKILSFRALLKRYTTTYQGTVNSSSALGAQIVCFTKKIFPGAVNYLVGDYASTLSFNTENPHVALFAYLKYGYMAYRGSYKHRIRMFMEGQQLNTENVNVRMLAISSEESAYIEYSDFITNNIPGPNSDTIAFPLEAIKSSLWNFLEGGVNYVLNSNGGIEFTTPYYNYNLFDFSFSRYGTPEQSSPSNVDDVGGISGDYPRSFGVTTLVNVEGEGNITFLEDTASGEDFSFFRFQGAPGFAGVFWTEN